MSEVRVRFAPSPTGPLHIGGVRTALYNYLFARKHGGNFILRIEDTDQTRYVPGAEKYIMEALEWLGLVPDEGPNMGGSYGPYRQSERKELYKAYAMQLIESGHAYYAFDTPEELETQRIKDPNFKYSHENRDSLRNSLTIDGLELQDKLDSVNTVVRLKFPKDEVITVQDEIRGEVRFDTSELDDKIILKGDGMPTYHLANIVDDHLMAITHVIRGEEWLPSTAHHIFMYQSLGWDAPSFSHLPLIFKPSGQGKLSKRDGAKFGFPVFPLTWENGPDDTWPGFREEGYLPQALLNFLAMLGWSSKSDQELFSRDELVEAFTLEGIVKSGARFDIEKAWWYNQQYIIHMDNEALAYLVVDQANDMGGEFSIKQLAVVCGMMKERVHKVNEILEKGYYLLKRPSVYDYETLGKKLKEENKAAMNRIAALVGDPSLYTSSIELGNKIKGEINALGIKLGEALPILRIGLTGTMQGPDIFETMHFLGPKESQERMLLILA